MRRSIAIAALLVTSVGCEAHWLPSTLFHASIAPSSVEPSELEWAALALASPAARAASVAATCALGPDTWVVWTTDLEGHGALMRVRRTQLGIEAQSFGAHDGPTHRPTLRAMHAGDTLVIVAESSTSPDSIERSAWLYAEDTSQIVPLMLMGASARLTVRGETQRALERGWSRAAIFTATFEATGGAVVVHEHESVREVALARPEQSARSTYEVERARTLTLHHAQLAADRPSLFDERE